MNAMSSYETVSGKTDFNEKILEQDTEWKHQTLKMNSAQPLQISQRD
jgi:hypothetical protein